MAMSLDDARKIARKKLFRKPVEVDHKAKFTNEQIEVLNRFVSDGIQTILNKIEDNPNVTHFGVIDYIGNRNTDRSYLDSYINLCNEQIKLKGYESDLIARLTTYDQRGNPNAYVPEANLITYHVEIVEKKSKDDFKPY